ncbi:MAG: hypothetical protein EU529_09570 [Promethearchaeota archaeon]|nr:MAG: hypothetical protein EU529_09570 [Candidatus Lokiarchaeota archaeon]
MTNNHNQSFFGQATGLTINSTSKDDPFIFLKCIKKKPDGTWEKPSQGEGKTIKLSLDEMVMVLKVLKRKIESWSSFHSYKENKTQISFSWEGNGGNKLWINIGNYSKLLAEAQIEIFKLLVKHLIKEKIEFATISNISKQRAINQSEKEDFKSTIMNNSVIKEQNSESKKAEIIGSIKAETGKAILLAFNNGQEVWIPKSIIYSNYKPEIGLSQTFLTENWILKRNNISA